MEKDQSRSVKRRIAAQNDEPAPSFEKEDKMPEKEPSEFSKRLISLIGSADLLIQQAVAVKTQIEGVKEGLEDILKKEKKDDS